MRILSGFVEAKTHGAEVSREGHSAARGAGDEGGKGRGRRGLKGADKRGRKEPLCSKERGGIDQKAGVELGQKTGTRVFFTRSQEVRR